jgi:homoserine dehydrogenase
VTESQVRRARLLLVGAGNVGRRFLQLMVAKEASLRDRLGLELVLAGVADSSGVAIDPDGLDPSRVIQAKAEGRGVSADPRWGRPGVTALEMIQTAEADLLLEASPANLRDGQPGLSCMEAALARGMHVVASNKAPLVLAFPHLTELARSHRVQLRFDATVTGGLPAINLGQRDLATAGIDRLEGILNLTTNYILTSMAEDGLTYDEALAHAQSAGHAEADPTLDVGGWDAASKLIILAHSVLGYPARLDDVTVEGITGITADMLRQAAAEGKRIKLLASAERQGDRYQLSVRPTWLEANHPMARLGRYEFGVAYYTDISGTISASILEETPLPTASAMLRDVALIYEA